MTRISTNPAFFKKAFPVIFLIAFSITHSFSESVDVKGEKYNLTVSYNKFSLPGDAVFVRVNLETSDKYLKDSPVATSGKIQIFEGDTELFESTSFDAGSAKDLGHADFYRISESSVSVDVDVEQTDVKEKKSFRRKKQKNHVQPLQTKKETILAGIPLSSYFKTGEHTIIVTLKPFGDTKRQITLPLMINNKEFVKETIQLDAKNTSIRTNDSDERWRQIKKLNGILGTTNNDAVYDLGPYDAPTPATRRTSFFADRRIYAYNNGKSATSLHYGIDYGIKEGSEVRACASGKVVLAETRITTGWSVVIEHLPGLYSLYYHNSVLKVNVGDIVKKGDLIAYSGKTGLATGAHLHWEMRLNMEAVSPDFFLGDFTFDTHSESR